MAVDCWRNQIHEINATDLLSMFALHTGQLIFIFAEQSSHKQTWPHGKQITYERNEFCFFLNNCKINCTTAINHTSFGFSTQTTHFSSSLNSRAGSLDCCRRSRRAFSSDSFNFRSTRSCFLRK